VDVDIPRGIRRRAPSSPAAVAEAPGLCVTALEGRDAGQFAMIPEAPGRLAVGSARGVELLLHDERVRPRHLELWVTPDGIAARDTGGGTYVGAVRLGEAVLRVGSRLRVGDTLLGLTAPAAPDDLRARFAAEGLAYAGPAMTEVAASVQRVAPFATTVLVQGETGTGKEVVARAIHRLSMRRNGPFVIVDCGALPPTLLESELFGHERGAFTGADRQRQGAFERAHGGTLMLDEIGELPLPSQPALLGVLQRRRFRRVGGQAEVEVDVRVIAATNRDLLAEVERGAFRPDLYYRLAATPIALPPLRSRPEDLPILIEHLLAELTGSATPSPFDAGAAAALAAYPWPGNVRELRAVVERALTLERFDLPAPRGAREDGAPRSAGAGPASTTELRTYREARAEALDGFEQGYLRRLIEASQGNASEAARVARMDRPHLLKLLRRHRLR
jgi:transcriptional regulator with GAF, ATPase, and Fis domain